MVTTVINFCFGFLIGVGVVLIIRKTMQTLLNFLFSNKRIKFLKEKRYKIKRLTDDLEFRSFNADVYNTWINEAKQEYNSRKYWFLRKLK